MEVDKVAHESTIAAYLAQHAMEPSLTAGATTEKAIAAGQAASDAILGEGGSAPMQD